MIVIDITNHNRLNHLYLAQFEFASDFYEFLVTLLTGFFSGTRVLIHGPVSIKADGDI